MGVREIRFRVWSIERQRWLYFGITNVPNWVHPAEIEQYTGFEDMNGAPIFEGDILNWTERTINGSFHTYKCKVFIHKNGAWWIEAHSRYFGETNKKKFELYNLRKQVEVIGNIFENPELLSNE